MQLQHPSVVASPNRTSVHVEKNMLVLLGLYNMLMHIYLTRSLSR